MEDYVMKEIDKIGQLLCALLGKMGVRRNSATAEIAVETAKTRTELVDDLNIDIDELLRDSDFIDKLVADHGFSEENLEQFGELLADFVAASDDRDEKLRLSAAACAIYGYLDERKAPPSLNRYYILRELARLNGQTTEPNENK